MKPATLRSLQRAREYSASAASTVQDILDRSASGAPPSPEVISELVDDAIFDLGQAKAFLERLNPEEL